MVNRKKDVYIQRIYTDLHIICNDVNRALIPGIYITNVPKTPLARRCVTDKLC